jgi:hypothetical protein
VTEVRAVGGPQADREVALETHVDRRLGLREEPRQRLRERHDRLVDDERARLALRVVLEWLGHPVAVVPAADHPHVSAVGIARLGDEGELRVERQRDVTDQAAKELVADRARGPFGNDAEQVPAAEARVGLVGVDVKRHDPLPGTDATEPRGPQRAAASARREAGSPAGCTGRLRGPC